MDVGCFGSFSQIYSSECLKFQRNHSSVVNRYSLCSIACKSYNAALSPFHLQSAFRKSGLQPLDQSLFTISGAILKQNQREKTTNDDDDVTLVTDVTSTAEDAHCATEDVTLVFFRNTSSRRGGYTYYVAKKISDETSTQSFFITKSTNVP